VITDTSKCSAASEEPQHADNDAFPLSEAAARLGISLRAARNAARKGDLPALRIGRRFFILRKRFEELIGNTNRT
jgi:excisionase family DNA binding protein